MEAGCYAAEEISGKKLGRSLIDAKVSCSLSSKQPASKEIIVLLLLFFSLPFSFSHECISMQMEKWITVNGHGRRDLRGETRVKPPLG